MKLPNATTAMSSNKSNGTSKEEDTPTALEDVFFMKPEDFELFINGIAPGALAKMYDHPVIDCLRRILILLFARYKDGTVRQTCLLQIDRALGIEARSSPIDINFPFGTTGVTSGNVVGITKEKIPSKMLDYFFLSQDEFKPLFESIPFGALAKKLGLPETNLTVGSRGAQFSDALHLLFAVNEDGSIDMTSSNLITHVLGKKGDTLRKGLQRRRTKHITPEADIKMLLEGQEKLALEVDEKNARIEALEERIEMIGLQSSCNPEAGLQMTDRCGTALTAFNLEASKFRSLKEKLEAAQAVHAKWELYANNMGTANDFIDLPPMDTAPLGLTVDLLPIISSEKTVHIINDLVTKTEKLSQHIALVEEKLEQYESQIKQFRHHADWTRANHA